MLAVILTNVPLENISDSQYNKVVGLFITELSNYGNPLFKAVICLEYIAPLLPLLNIAIYAL